MYDILFEKNAPTTKNENEENNDCQTNNNNNIGIIQRLPIHGYGNKQDMILVMHKKKPEHTM